MQTLKYSRRLFYLLTLDLPKLSKNKINCAQTSTIHKITTHGDASGTTWWAQMDLNHRPRAYQARALTN